LANFGRTSSSQSPADAVGHREELNRTLANVELLETAACQRYRPPPSQVACSFKGVDHGHGIVPAHERGHDHGRGHGHGNVEATGLIIRSKET
jgi:hypothetical protein